MTEKTRVAIIDRIQPDPQLLALAGEIIRQGGLVAFPTETVYGLGANALDAAAVQRIFSAKERPANDPIIVHLHALEQLEQVAASLPPSARDLAAAFWPGALTLILPKHPALPANLTAGQPTVAVRIPAHPVALALLRAAGVPIGAPSANRFARPSPTTAAHVFADLAGRVDVILDGGSTDIGIESTIVDLTMPVPTVLRPGGVPLETLAKVLPTVAFRPQYLAEDAPSAPAPGSLLKHYAPQAEVCLYRGEADAVLAAMRAAAAERAARGQRVGIFVLDGDALSFEQTPAQIVLGGHDLMAFAAGLYAGLRALDASGVDVILVRAPHTQGIGLAIYDRLLRAAEGRVLDV